MSKTIALLLIVLLFPAMTAAQDSPQALVEKAIEARGGADDLARFDAMRFKVKGTMFQGPNPEGLPFVMEETWHLPDRFRTVLTLIQPNTTTSQTFVINGDKAWMKAGGQVIDLPKKVVEQLKEQKQAEMMGHLRFLEQKGIELKSLEDSEVGGKPAAGVLVKAKGVPEVQLYFDKKTGLLVKRANKGFNPTGEATMEEIHFAEFKKKGGFKLPRMITMVSDGKTVAEGEVIEIEFLEEPDEGLFSKPE